jgi:spore maturation protein CgeB
VKVLVVHPGPHFSVSDVYNGVVKGLKQNGCEVATLNLNDRLDFYGSVKLETPDGEHVRALEQAAACTMASQGLEVACYEYWPDVVIVVSGWFIPPHVWGVLARRPHHVVYWCTESPYEDDRQGQPARYVDTVILNDPTNLGDYRANINERTFYLPHSFDPDIHHPGPADPELECDFGFAGTGFPSRIEFFEAVDWSGIDVKLGGNWKNLDDDSVLRPMLAHDIENCMDNTVTADLYRSAKIGANLYRKEHSEFANAAGWSMGPREVELAACETFFLRESRPEGDELFPMLPTFDNTEDFESQMRWYLDHPDERLELARAARVAVADRTFQNTAANLLQLIDRVPATVR